MVTKYIEEISGQGVCTLKMLSAAGSVTTLRTDLLSQFEASIERIAKDSGVRVVIITGKDNKFLVGADLREMRERTIAENIAYNQRLINLFNRLEALPQPIIAAISGNALGGGLELALACTIRFADTGASLGLPEINLGLIPGAGGTQRLPRLIPPGAAWKLLLTGDVIDAVSAHSLGLVDELCPNGTVLDRARDFAERLAQKPQLAVRAIKDAVITGRSLGVLPAIDYTAEKLREISRSANFTEGIEAFLSKRKPVFGDQ